MGKLSTRWAVVLLILSVGSVGAESSKSLSIQSILQVETGALRQLQAELLRAVDDTEALEIQQRIEARKLWKARQLVIYQLENYPGDRIATNRLCNELDDLDRRLQDRGTQQPAFARELRTADEELTKLQGGE